MFKGFFITVESDLKMRSYRARNKRIISRSRNGRFRKTTGADFGIGVCENEGCNHLTRRVYDGNSNDPFPDPRLFRQRCFTCEPLTEREKQQQAEIEANKPKQKTLEDCLREIADKY